MRAPSGEDRRGEKKYFFYFNLISGIKSEEWLVFDGNAFVQYIRLIPLHWINSSTDANSSPSISLQKLNIIKINHNRLVCNIFKHKMHISQTLDSFICAHLLKSCLYLLPNTPIVYNAELHISSIALLSIPIAMSECDKLITVDWCVIFLAKMHFAVSWFLYICTSAVHYARLFKNQKKREWEEWVKRGEGISIFVCTKTRYRKKEEEELYSKENLSTISPDQRRRHRAASASVDSY